MSHQAALDAALADKVETQCAEAVKTGRMFRSLHKKGTDEVVEGGKKTEASSPVPSPSPPTTAAATIQQVCAKKLSQRDQNDYVIDEMSTRGVCMYETNAVWYFRSDAVQKSVGAKGVMTLPSTQKPAPRYLDELEPFIISHV